MNKLSTRDYKKVLQTYGQCFAWLFPDLNFVCYDGLFTLRERRILYDDISGISISKTHFILEVKGELQYYLPICESARYDIRTVEKNPIKISS